MTTRRRPTAAGGSPGAATRATAARVVHAVVREGRTLEAALAAHLPRDARDRARVQALCYGTVRSWHRLRWIRNRLLTRPIRPADQVLESLIDVGLFELRSREQPDYAIVSAGVAAVELLGRPRAAGLVNASLRRFRREEALLEEAADGDEEARWSHPQWLIRALRDEYPDRAERVLAGNQAPPPLWLRRNRLSGNDADIRAAIAATGAAITADPGLPQAWRIDPPVDVTAIPAFREGAFSVQDRSAQLAGLLLAPARGQRVLDACAAPGGKTTHLLELADGELDLTALDVDGQRLARVRENLARLGLAARVVEGNAASPESWWDGQPYDAILIDAPCSGTGVIRRHPDIKILRRPGDIAPLALQQQRLLGALWPLLAPGGRMLYATCSSLAAENREVVAGFLARHPEARLQDIPPAGFPAPQGDGPGWQLLPDDPAGGDGFFYALMMKPSG